MPEKPYNLYRRSRLGTRRPLRIAAPGGGSAAAVRTCAGTGTVTSRVRAARWITTLAMLAGLSMILYAGWVFGHGYFQAKLEQGQLRSLFAISGNGSVDPQYLMHESAALRSRLAHLDPVGEIDIPGIGVRWMMVEGSDDAALAKGPGHIDQTALPGAGGNFAVAGDRVLYGAPFLHLDEVRAGDEIRVRMPYATFIYRVSETFIVTPDDVSVLQPTGREAITLLTCDPPWDIKQRITVRAELQQVLPAGTGI